MNVSLLAMSNSLAESFIIVNSIFFGVSDIGISTVVQQAAFYGLINQGMFYLIVQEGTLIDWWIVSRETAFFLLYLAVMSVDSMALLLVVRMVSQLAVAKAEETAASMVDSTDTH